MPVDVVPSVSAICAGVSVTCGGPATTTLSGQQGAGAWLDGGAIHA